MPGSSPGMTARILGLSARTKDALTPASANAAIDREDHARRVTRAVGCEVSHEIADLTRVRGTAERKAFLIFAVAVLVAELVLCPRFQQRDVTVGADGAGID